MENIPKNAYGFFGSFADDNTDYKAYNDIT